MKKIIGMLAVLAVVATGTSATIKGSEMIRSVVCARFTVHSHDMAIEVFDPVVSDNTTHEIHPVLAGALVTVLLNDAYEMASPPQCHWDGVNEKSRYCYTVYYRQKGINDGSVTAYSLDLRDFVSISEDASRKLHIIPMGVVPKDGIVHFRTASFKDITSGSDPWAFVTKD